LKMEAVETGEVTNKRGDVSESVGIEIKYFKVTEFSKLRGDG